jgi:hypothetical protein
MRAMKLLLFPEHPLHSLFAGHLRRINAPLKAIHICGAVCVGKKRVLIPPRSIVCWIVLGSSASHNPLIYNIKRFRSYEKGEREEKRKQGKAISGKVWTAVQINY